MQQHDKAKAWIRGGVRPPGMRAMRQPGRLGSPLATAKCVSATAGRLDGAARPQLHSSSGERPGPEAERISLPCALPSAAPLSSAPHVPTSPIPARLLFSLSCATRERGTRENEARVFESAAADGFLFPAGVSSAVGLASTDQIEPTLSGPAGQGGPARLRGPGPGGSARRHKEKHGHHAVRLGHPPCCCYF